MLLGNVLPEPPGFRNPAFGSRKNKTLPFLRKQPLLSLQGKVPELGLPPPASHTSRCKLPLKPRQHPALK